MPNESFLWHIFIMALYNPLLVKKLEEHLKKDPGSRSFCSLAQIYCAQGEWDKAEKLCLEGLAHNPSYSPAYVLLAEIYKSQDLTDKAIKYLTRAKECNPENPNIYKNLGDIYKKQNDLEKSLQAYKMLAFLKPGDKTASATVQHLEKIMGGPIDIRQVKGHGKKPSKPLSEKDSQKLAKLNKILARVEMYKDEQPEK